MSNDTQKVNGILLERSGGPAIPKGPSQREKGISVSGLFPIEFKIFLGIFVLVIIVGLIIVMWRMNKYIQAGRFPGLKIHPFHVTTLHHMVPPPTLPPFNLNTGGYGTAGRPFPYNPAIHQPPVDGNSTRMPAVPYGPRSIYNLPAQLQPLHVPFTSQSERPSTRFMKNNRTYKAQLEAPVNPETPPPPTPRPPTTTILSTLSQPSVISIRQPLLPVLSNPTPGPAAPPRPPAPPRTLPPLRAPRGLPGGVFPTDAANPKPPSRPATSTGHRAQSSYSRHFPGRSTSQETNKEDEESSPFNLLYPASDRK